MHALLLLISEGLTSVPGKRWRGFVAAAIALLLVWLLLLWTR